MRYSGMVGASRPRHVQAERPVTRPPRLATLHADGVPCGEIVADGGLASARRCQHNDDAAVVKALPRGGQCRENAARERRAPERPARGGRVLDVGNAPFDVGHGVVQAAGDCLVPARVCAALQLGPGCRGERQETPREVGVTYRFVFDLGHAPA